MQHAASRFWSPTVNNLFSAVPGRIVTAVWVGSVNKDSAGTRTAYIPACAALTCYYAKKRKKWNVCCYLSHNHKIQTFNCYFPFSTSRCYFWGTLDAFLWASVCGHFVRPRVGVFPKDKGVWELRKTLLLCIRKNEDSIIGGCNGSWSAVGRGHELFSCCWLKLSWRACRWPWRDLWVLKWKHLAGEDKVWTGTCTRRTDGYRQSCRQIN